MPKPKSPYANKSDLIIANCKPVQKMRGTDIMKRLAIMSIVLLLAGIGLAFGLTETGQSACGAPCPNAGCGGAGGCQACCGDNCAACCGSSTDQSASVTPACAAACPNAGCGGEGGCQACCGDDCDACCGSTVAKNENAAISPACGKQCSKGGCGAVCGSQACPVQC